jgi:ParB/RepB/Spo0J family partition protein
MSVADTDTVHVSRAIPLEQLREPETDVREHRPDSKVKSIAASMGDSDVGQMQDILVHPLEDSEAYGTDDETVIDEHLRDGGAFRVVDGETRRLAAQQLGWATIHATVVPEPPEDTVVAQIDANTERVDMTDFEVLRGLKDWYEETQNTLQDVADATGYSEGHVSKMFTLLDAPDPITEPWQNPDAPFETGHARAVRTLLTDDRIESLVERTDLDEDEAREQAMDDVHLMVGVQLDKNLTAQDLRERSQRRHKEVVDELKDDRSLDEKRADGQRRKAEQEHTSVVEEEPDPCMVCGGDRPHRRKFALDVCEEDYGMLTDMAAQGDQLLATGDVQEVSAGELPDGPVPETENQRRVLELLQSFPEDEVAAVREELEMATSPQEAGADD